MRAKVDPVLNKAALLAKRREYESALKILKDEEDRYNGSFRYYYLYAVICLYAGSFAEAKKSFDNARKIKINDASVMLGHAILYLRRMDTGQAVEYYLNVQEKDPKNKIAKNALAVIKKYSSSEDLSNWLTFERLEKLFPKIPSPAVDLRFVLKVSLSFALIIIILYSLLTAFNFLPNPFARDQRPVSEFVLSGLERSDPVQVDGFYRYILTRDQATGLYDRALSLFSSYRDEAAKINLNRILESNASEGLKNRARLMMVNMQVPGFDNFNRNDNPTFSAVNSEPVIYRDVHVIWRGLATNVEVTDEYTRFDLLVGYDTRTTLEGIIPVIFDKPVAINIMRPIEVLGRIVLAASYTDIRLEGVAIHQSGRLE
jgi:tetratricopeptide (TPR) repeat protein